MQTPTSDPMYGQVPGEVRDDNALKLKLVWCPPGTFTMGSPKTDEDRNDDEDQMSVTLTKGFWLGRYAVTQSEWKQVMKIEPWKEKPSPKEGSDFPAACVSWDDATDFCCMLTEQERKAGRLSGGCEYTLPTEAQWECACRARTETRFSFGDDESRLGDYAWFCDNTSQAGESFVHQVGQKKPNPWGLYDMHGNIFEWCRDFYTEKLPGGTDAEAKPDEQTGGSYRVYRGGYIGFNASDCRSAFRRRNDPGFRSSGLGFRLALCAVQ